MTIAPIIAVNALDLQQVNKLHQCIILTNKQKYKKSMLKHIVMWRYKDGAEGKTALTKCQLQPHITEYSLLSLQTQKL